ncbi:MAG: hypothetical protein N3D71_12445 [Burkholderiaceae bacterium]|nr:hypothetical protein [Burkholderiaceae bacterium]
MSLDELALIRALQAAHPAPPGMLGIGDDCCVWQPRGGVCLSTDAIVEGRDAAVPAEIDLQYAVAAALAARALRARGTPDAPRTWGRILDYAQRFPQREMGVMLVADMQRGIGQPLFAVPQFSGWAHAVADLLLYD